MVLSNILAPAKRYLTVTLVTLSVAGAGAIVTHEGMRRVAYKDPVGIVTVCAGHTLTAKLGQVKTDSECLELLRLDTAHAQSAVRALVKVPVTQGQYDALVSLVFNIGEPQFRKSTLLKKLNAGQCLAAGKEFGRWVYAKGTKLPGLVTRRAYEGEKFSADCK